jgi:hypothetical protein
MSSGLLPAPTNVFQEFRKMNQSPSPKQSKLLHTLISLMIILMQVTLPFGATVAALQPTPQMVGDLARQLGFVERSVQILEEAAEMLPYLFSAPQTAQAASGGIEYRITFNAALGRYEVYLRPTATPSAPNQTVTAQVTLKAPHVTGLGSFNPATVIAQVPGTDWALTSRTNAPSEDPSADYLSFELSFPTNNHSAINWQSGQEVLAFSFANSGSCAGAVTVMDNGDPFNTLPNSANTNPGNQIEVVGLGDDPGNDYLGNYGSAALCSASPGIEYRVAYNSGANRYEVWMRPTVTPNLPNQTVTAQVTLKAPHVAGSLAFTPTNLIPYTDTLWSLGSLVRSPSEDANADYLSFDVSFPTNHTGTFAWQANVERLVFSFQNTLCAGPVTIMEDSDAFNQLPNSTNTNPGQAIDVVSLGSDPGNDFIGTYGLGQGDCDRDGDGAVNGSDLDDDGDGILDSVEGGLTVDTDNDGIPNNLDLDADGDGIPDNIEAQSTAGYVAPSGSDSDNDGLDNAYEGAGDAGLTPVNTDGDSGPALPDYLDIDSDNAQGNDSSEAGLTLSGTDADQDGIDDGADSNDSAFGPTNAGVANPSTTYPNSNSSGDVDYRDAVTTAPDLVTTLGQPTPSLMAGVQSNLPVTVTNQGDALASGPITTTVTLPAGVSAPAIFSGGNGWSCTTSGQTVTCVNAGALNNGVSSNLIVPITAAAAGGPVTINATTTPVSGENNTGNNAAAPLTTSTGIAAFVDGCFAVTVTLSGAQETPPNNSTATGSAVVLVNTNANTLDYNLTFSGLTPNMAHIHGFSAPGVSSGVVHNLPGLTSPQMSQWGFAEGDQANILAGLSYFNLHTAAFGGGEIRGQIGALAPAACPAVILPIKVILGGAYQSSTGLMRTQLRTLSDFPLVSPYGGSATITNSAVLTANNIVDWVWVELRDSTTPATVVASQAGLLQHDGDVVGVNGVSPLSFSGLASNTVYVAVKHRNHLAVMTANPVTLSASTATVDFTAPATAVYGSNARRTVGSKTVLWAGNANGNTNVIGAGPNNDVSSILLTVFSDPGNGNFNVNYIVPGYKRSDVNMDGKTIGAGPNNDVNTVLTTVFSHPSNTTFAANYIVLQQLP